MIVAPPTDLRCITKLNDFEALLHRLESAKVIAVDTETSTLEVVGNKFTLAGFCLAVDEVTGYYVPIGHRPLDEGGLFQEPQEQLNADLVLREMKRILEDRSKHLLLHNVKFDSHVLLAFGIDISHTAWFDTFVASHILDDRTGNKIEECCEREFGYRPGAFKQLMIQSFGKQWESKGKNFTYLDIHDATPYAASDAVNCYRLWKRYMPQINGSEAARKLFWSIEMPLIPVVGRIEQVGIKLDIEYLLNLKEELDIEEDAALQRLTKAVGRRVDFSKKKDERHAFFKDMHLPIVARSNKTGFPKLDKSARNKWRAGIRQRQELAAACKANLTNENRREIRKVITQIWGSAPIKQEGLFGKIRELDDLLKRQEEFVKAYELFVKARKIKNTYTLTLIAKVAQDGRLHTSLNQMGTKSGRFCVAADTELETSAGTFCISELDLTKYQDVSIVTHKLRPRRILGKCYKGREEMFEVKLADGRWLHCTQNHGFLTPRGWRKLNEIWDQEHPNILVLSSCTKKSTAKYVWSGDQGQELIAAVIVSIQSIGIEDVWDIEVEEDHSYLAHGFVNHNSSNNPNWQNLPRDKKWDIRKAFYADKGYVFVLSDYSSMEMKIAAAISQCPVLTGIVTGQKRDDEGNPIDIHLYTASVAFKFDYNYGARIMREFNEKIRSEDDPEYKKVSKHRQDAKPVNFGILYGISKVGLADQLECGEDEAQKLIDAFFQAYPGVNQWYHIKQTTIPTCGYTETVPLGRRRRVQDWLMQAYRKNPKDKRLKRMMGEFTRACINHIIQGTGADVMKFSMLRIQKRLEEEGFYPDARICNQIHDEAIVLCPVSMAWRVKKIIKEEMIFVLNGVDLDTDAEAKTTLSKAAPDLFKGKQFGDALLAT